ncbi:hypothetical protein FJTKL_11464 [Diaporthe vaccinii]|uniref:Uncharacterized protein n=1 Tax=Diaporthe vaccinii TaxID=105482 RepID=A0ABR4EGM2_9PEZI
MWGTLLTSRSLVSVAWRHFRDVTPPLPARASLVTSGISSIITQPCRPVSGPFSGPFSMAISGPFSRSTAHRSTSTVTTPFIAWSSSIAAIASATVTSAIAPMSWFSRRPSRLDWFVIRVADTIAVNPWWQARPAIVALNLFVSAWVFYIPVPAGASFSPTMTAGPVGPFAMIPTPTPFVLTSAARKVLVHIAPRFTKWQTADVVSGGRAILRHVSPYGVGPLLDWGRDW